MVSRGHIGEMTKLKLLTGKEAKHREIDICERMKYVCGRKYRVLLGFYHFPVADWGGGCRSVQEYLDDCLSLPR